MEMRNYQVKAVDALYRHLETRDDNPCVVIPTGGGKTPCIAKVCSDTVNEWRGRVIILAHVKELLEQSLRHIEEAAPNITVGIYSAGLGARDTGYPVTIAGIQSAYRNVMDFPPADLIIVDEAHRIPPDGEGMYRQFLQAMKEKNPHVRLIGFTATPYRTSTGAICSRENLLNRICFEVGVRELIEAGYLSKLVSRGGTVDDDFTQVPVVRGEFGASQLEEFMSTDIRVALAVSDILGRCKDRKKILIFASGVDHGRKVAQFLNCDPDQSGPVGEIYGETDSDERAELVKRFRDGDLRILINRDVLTLGFDAPNVDCVALIRATMSPGLYYQMVGRGFRIAEGKKDCMVLDFGGNVVRHGPVDAIVPDTGKKNGGGSPGEFPAKKCPECCLIVPSGSAQCPECGFAFPPREAKHETKAYAGNILAEPEEVDVVGVSYSLHVKRDSDSRTLRVDYKTGFGTQVSEFICLEHKGFPYDKARGWWSRRFGKGPIPKTIEEALALTDRLAIPKRILVDYSGRFSSIKGYRFTAATPQEIENRPF